MDWKKKNNEHSSSPKFARFRILTERSMKEVFEIQQTCARARAPVAKIQGTDRHHIIIYVTYQKVCG